jgi:hypothetical protein
MDKLFTGPWPYGARNAQVFACLSHAGFHEHEADDVVSAAQRRACSLASLQPGSRWADHTQRDRPDAWEQTSITIEVLGTDIGTELYMVTVGVDDQRYHQRIVVEQVSDQFKHKGRPFRGGLCAFDNRALELSSPANMDHRCSWAYLLPNACATHSLALTPRLRMHGLVQTELHLLRERHIRCHVHAGIERSVHPVRNIVQQGCFVQQRQGLPEWPGVYKAGCGQQ